LFRGSVNTKKGEKLHPAGSLSYSTIRSLLLKKLEELGGIYQLVLGYRVFVQEESRLQLEQYQTVCSSSMADGNLTRPRMAMLRIRSNIGCQLPRILASDKYLFVWVW